MEDSQSSPPGRKRKLGFFAKLFCVLGLLLFLLAAYILFWPQTKIKIGYDTTRLTGPIDSDGYVDYLAAMDQQQSEGVTDENNAAVLLVRVFGPEGISKAAYQRWGQTMQDTRERLVGWGDFWSGAVTTRPELLKVYSDKFAAAVATSRPWREQESPLRAEWLRANRVPLDLIRLAVQRPRYYEPMDVPTERPKKMYLSLSSLGTHMEAGRCLQASALFRAGQGDIDGAAADIMTIHRLARLLGEKNKPLIHQMVAIVLDSFADKTATALTTSGTMTPAQARRLIDQIVALPAATSVADSVDQGDRYSFLDVVQTAARDGYKDYANTVNGQAKPVGWVRYAHVDWNQVMREGNQWLDRVVAAMRQPTYAKRAAELDKMAEEIKAKKSNLVLNGILHGPTAAVGDMLVTMLCPGLGNARVDEDRAELTRQFSVLALALSAYKSTHGEYPANLDKLAPEFLAAIPKDIFTDGPPSYRRSGAGYLLYTYGPNQKDQGGAGSTAAAASRPDSNITREADIFVKADK